MRTNNRKQSGLDIEALNAKMNALDQKAEKEKEVQQESVDLKELVEELQLTIGDVRHLVPKVRELSVSVEQAGKQLEEAGKEGDMAYTAFQSALAKANAEGIKIEASTGCVCSNSQATGSPALKTEPMGSVEMTTPSRGAATIVVDNALRISMMPLPLATAAP